MCQLFLLWSIVLISFYGTVQTIESVNYCEIASCDNPKEHTMCLYPTLDPGPACKIANFNNRTMDAWQQSKILQAHNRVRQKVASGGLSGPVPFGMGFPPAKHMPLFTWDDELAMFAQHWANQCTIGRDKCRNTAEWDNVGQLVFIREMETSVYTGTKHASWVLASPIYTTYTEAFALTMEEEMDITNTENLRLMKFKNLAQLLWDKTSILGCARAEFNFRLSTNVIKPYEWLVCNYARGNKMYGPMYEPGRPCSKCSCNMNYTALCNASGAFGVSAYPLVLSGFLWLRF